jgi:Spy/CpxP family protein refolding chaperone
LAVPNIPYTNGTREARRAQNRPALTPEQIAQYKAKREAARAAVNAQRAQTKALTDQLRAEMQKKPADKNKIQNLIRQIDIQRETLRLQQMQTMISQRKNFTPDQQKRYNDMITAEKAHLAKLQLAK